MIYQSADMFEQMGNNGYIPFLFEFLYILNPCTSSEAFVSLKTAGK